MQDDKKNILASYGVSLLYLKGRVGCNGEAV